VAVIYIAPQIGPDSNNMTQSYRTPGVQPLFPGGLGATHFTTDICTLFTNVPDGNETYILGYPVELFNKKIPLEVDFDFPMIRKGIVSQKNRKTQKLIIDSGVYGGNSGGPVLILNENQFKLVGLITQFVPVSTRIVPEAGVTNSVLVNSGYGVVEPIDFALELMREF
jgi:hypothetical protein